MFFKNKKWGFYYRIRIDYCKLCGCVHVRDKNTRLNEILKKLDKIEYRYIQTTK